jgi:type 1 glutamine amidotransferase
MRTQYLTLILCLAFVVSFAFTISAFAQDDAISLGSLDENGLLTFEPVGVDEAVAHIVLIAGDEEYRSEEAMPMLGRLLATQHGFRCTVLFSMDPENGLIDPLNQTNIPGMEILADADLIIIDLRFRELPDESMRHFDEYVHSGKPMIGLRTATHAFSYSRDRESPYVRYHHRSSEWPGGFGQQVLGDTWINHHGLHKSESTRGVRNEAEDDNPILNGVEDVWGTTDVYGIKNLGDEATVLLWGQVLEGMEPDSAPLEGPKNDPMMPLAWTRPFETRTGATARVFCTTMGAATDFENEDLRRLLVNASYWALELENEIPARADADVIGEYDPNPYGFGDYKEGLKPSSWILE